MGIKVKIEHLVVIACLMLACPAIADAAPRSIDAPSVVSDRPDEACKSGVKKSKQPSKSRKGKQGAGYVAYTSNDWLYQVGTLGREPTWLEVMWGWIVAYLMLAIIVGVVIPIVVMAALWGIFSRAGKPGCAALIPGHNLVVLNEIAGLPIHHWFLLAVPGVNVVAAFFTCQGLARAFGRGRGFGVGLLLLPPVFFPLLAILGKSQARGAYVGPAEEVEEAA